MDKKKMWKPGLLILLAGGVLVSALMWKFQREPSGLDVWGHMFKAHELYESIKAGDWYPLYTQKWYNGMELFRYWPPFSYYVLCALMLFTGGNVLTAYNLFGGCVFFLGGLPFLLQGRKLGRPYMGLLCGCLLFILPDSIRVFWIEGNIPRITATVLMAYVIYFAWSYLHEGRKWQLVVLMGLGTILSFNHLMFTAVAGIGTFLYLLCDWFAHKRTHRSIEILCSMVFGIMLGGVWVIPAVSGGMLSTGESQTQELLTFNLDVSLNTKNRITGDAGVYYFGISVFVIAVLGSFLAKKKNAGFLVAILVILGTTPATISIIKHLPLSGSLWMNRFTAFAYLAFLVTLMEWKTLKKKYLIPALSFLIIDCLVSVITIPRYYYPATESALAASEALVEHTTQRANLMDVSEFISYPAWGITEGKDAVNYVFGWAWQGAATSENLYLINEAMEQEEYHYVFDRSIEFGSDTVYMAKKFVTDAEAADKMYVAAEDCGYTLLLEQEYGYLFHMDTPECFGTTFEYAGLSIGENANLLTVYLPVFENGASDYVDEYSAEELKQYKVIYLSGFYYHDKDEAEALLTDVAAAGTRVVIDVCSIPEDGLKNMEFLNVTKSTISVDEYPTIWYEEEAIFSGELPDGDVEWNVSYANVQGNTLATATIGGLMIPVVGSVADNSNLVFVGLNLPYYAMRTGNQEIWSVLEECFTVERGQTPVREIVPLNIEYGEDEIVIHSDIPNVNTSLAYQESFRSGQEIYEVNNFLVIGERDVTIQLTYPHRKAGIAVTAVGAILAGLFFWNLSRRRDEEGKNA